MILEMIRVQCGNRRVFVAKSALRGLLLDDHQWVPRESPLVTISICPLPRNSPNAEGVPGVTCFYDLDQIGHRTLTERELQRIRFVLGPEIYQVLQNRLPRPSPSA